MIGYAISICVPYDGSCTGTHGEMGDCCAGFYCHKPNPAWAQGRCYLPAQKCAKFGELFSCNSFSLNNRVKNSISISDDVCEGEHGKQGNCCDRSLYCHKHEQSWAQGRCYRVKNITPVRPDGPHIPPPPPHSPQASFPIMPPVFPPFIPAIPFEASPPQPSLPQPTEEPILPGLHPAETEAPASSMDGDDIIQPGFHMDPNLIRKFWI